MPLYGGIRKTCVKNHKRFEVFTWLNTSEGVKRQVKQLHDEGFHTAVIHHTLTKGLDKGKKVYVVYRKLNPNSWRAKLRRKK